MQPLPSPDKNPSSDFSGIVRRFLFSAFCFCLPRGHRVRNLIPNRDYGFCFVRKTNFFQACQAAVSNYFLQHRLFSFFGLAKRYLVLRKDFAHSCGSDGPQLCRILKTAVCRLVHSCDSRFCFLQKAVCHTAYFFNNPIKPLP